MTCTATTSETRGPSAFFEHEIVVEDAHIDRFGHANNVVILQWIQDVAEAHSASVGFPLEAYERLGAGFVVRRHELDYLRASGRGDRLCVRTWVESAKSVSCSRVTEILSVVGGHLMAKATTSWVFAELATLRVLRIPDDLRVAFGFSPRRFGGAAAPNV